MPPPLPQDKGNLTGAEPFLRQGAEGMTALRGERDEEAITSRANFASLLMAKGDAAAAEPRLREVLQTSRETLGEEHHLTQRCHSQYGGCVQLLGYSAVQEDPLYCC